MSTKQTLRVTLPDGEIATRKSARTYTHAILVRSDLEREAAQAAEAIAQLDAYVADGHWTQEERDRSVARREEDLERNRRQPWGVLAWCGRLELAQKRLDEARRDGTWAEVRLVEVDA